LFEREVESENAGNERTRVMKEKVEIDVYRNIKME
jgi:hypothetical protein